MQDGRVARGDFPAKAEIIAQKDIFSTYFYYPAPAGISPATASSSSPSISSRSSGRIVLTIAPYPNLSSTPPPIARLLTIRGYGPVGTEDAISGLTQPWVEGLWLTLVSAARLPALSTSDITSIQI